jgi:hypothetical protein
MIGRSELSQSAAARYNGGSKSVKPSSAGTYGNTKSSSFINDLWTAQVLAYWVTDGNAFTEARDGGQVGRVLASKGFSPSNISPLVAKMNSNGALPANLISTFNPSGNTNPKFLLGPDGMFGPAAESIVEEWAGTNKLFGKTISDAKARMALDRLAANIKTPKIDAARAKRAAGTPPASREVAARTPCNQLSDTAAAARKDCPARNRNTGSTTPKKPSGSGSGTTPAPKKKGGGSATAAKGTNWLLWGGIASGALLLTGAGLYFYNTSKKQSM